MSHWVCIRSFLLAWPWRDAQLWWAVDSGTRAVGPASLVQKSSIRNARSTYAWFDWVGLIPIFCMLFSWWFECWFAPIMSKHVTDSEDSPTLLTSINKVHNIYVVIVSKISKHLGIQLRSHAKNQNGLATRGFFWCPCDNFFVQWLLLCIMAKCRRDGVETWPSPCHPRALEVDEARTYTIAVQCGKDYILSTNGPYTMSVLWNEGIHFRESETWKYAGYLAFCSSNQLLGLAIPTDVRSLQSLQDRPKHGQNVGKPY